MGAYFILRCCVAIIAFDGYLLRCSIGTLTAFTASVSSGRGVSWALCSGTVISGMGNGTVGLGEKVTVATGGFTESISGLTSLV